MNTSVPRPEKPPASGSNGSADDDLVAADQGEPALHPAGGLTGGPDRQDGSGEAGDEEDDDEYEPL